MRDRALGSTIRIYFTTHQSTGVAVAPSSAFVAADFRIYKDGSATEKTTANGITVTSPFDSVVGAHLIEIDTSNATGDTGFWASGSAYRVVLSTAKTVDSKDPSGVCVGEFSIELQTADVRKLLGTAWLTPGTAGTPDVNTKLISGDSVAADNAEAFFDGTGYAGTNNVMPTVTTLTNLPAITAGWLTAAGIAADAITAAKIADGAIDTATFASGTTLPRVTLVDTTTTNTDMRGTDNAALAATALTTAVWTSTIAGRIDVAVSTRLAPLVAGRDIAVAATTGAVELDSTATAALVDLIWDEPLTGATHNVATSSGKRLRQTTAFQQIDSTVIDASATTTTFVTGLTSSVDDFYNDSMLVFTDGALAGQVRAIYDYIGATKTIILEEALTSAPVNGVAFAIVSLHIHPVSQIQAGLATAAALATESTKINRIEAVATGTVTGAGTSTEVFVGPSATLTITVDASGNRSAVVVT